MVRSANSGPRFLERAYGGNSLRFNNTSSQDTVTITADSSYKTPMLSGFTALMWLKMDTLFSTTGTFDRIIAHSGPSGSERFWELWGGGNDDRLRFRLCDNSTSQSISGVTGITGNQWVLVGCIYDPGSRTAVILNDSIDFETTPTVTLADNGNDTFLACFSATSSLLKSLIGYVVMIDHPMTAAEVSDFYYKHKLPVSANKLMEFDFSEGTGTTLTDLSGNSNNGSINNSTWTTESPFANRGANGAARTALTQPMARFPYYEYSDLGVTSLWDFRTGYTGDNSNFVMDMIGGQSVDNYGTTSYTSGEFSNDYNGSTGYSLATRTPANETGMTEFTGFAWVKLDTTADTIGVMGRWRATGQASWLLSSVNSSGSNLNFRVFLSSDGTASTWTRTDTLPDVVTGWVFVTFVYDGAAQTVTYYIDGSAVSSVVNGTPPTSLHQSTKPNSIGAWFNGSDVATGFVDGKIGVCGVAANKKMTAGEVTTLYNISRTQMGQ